MSLHRIIVVTASACLIAASGCKSINHGTAALSQGVKSIGDSLAFRTSRHSIFSQRAEQTKTADSTSLPQGGGFPTDHYTNSPEFQSLATKTPSSNPFVRAWQSTTNTLNRAITFKPKPDLPRDEISLSTKAEPLGADFFVIAGQGLEVRGDVVAAESQYNKALESEPTNINALMGLARVLAKQERVEAATAAYQKALALHPRNAELANDTGIFQWKQQRLDDAVVALQQAVALDPQNVRYRNNLATVLVDADQPKQALDQLMAVHSPDSAHYNLGFLLHRRGREAEARRHLQFSLQENPQLAPAVALLSQLNSAGALSFAPSGPTLPAVAQVDSPQHATIQRATTLLNPVPLESTPQSAETVSVAERKQPGESNGETSAPPQHAAPIIKVR